MTKIFLVLLILTACMAAPSQANTTLYTLNLKALPHGNYHTWGIDSPLLGQNEKITGVALTTQLLDHPRYTGVVLTTYLMDNPNPRNKGNSRHLKTGSDPDSGTDYFAGQGTGVGKWNDSEGPATKADLVYNFDALGELNAHARTSPSADIDNGSNKERSRNFGLDFDPDRQYTTSGNTFAITTSPIVPAPGAILLAGIGTSLIGWMRRRRAL